MLIEKPKSVALLFAATFLVALIPIFVVSHPAQVDLPNHLARHYIAATLDSSEYLSQFYTFDWRFSPYLVSDALYIPLINYFSPYDAGRIVLAFIFFLWLTAGLFLHRVLWGAFSSWPLVSAFALYNANTTWGFESYALGTAFALWLFVSWIAWNPAKLSLKVVIFSVLATLLYLTHVFAFALFGVLMLSYEGGKLLRDSNIRFLSTIKRLFFVSLPFWPATSHFILSFDLVASSHSNQTSFGGWVSRAQILVSPVNSSPVFNYDYNIDAVIVAVLVFVFILHISRRNLEIHSSVKLVLLSLGIITIVMPWNLSGVAFTHHRLPFIFVMLLISSSRWKEIAAPRYRMVAAAFAVLFAVRIFAIAGYWQGHDEQVREILESFNQVDKGARILPVAESHELTNLNINHYHTAALAVIERGAYIPTLFTGATLLGVNSQFAEMTALAGHPVDLEGLVAARARATAGSTYLAGRREIYWRHWWRDYTHVLIFFDEGSENPFPDILFPLYKGSFFTLYQNIGFEFGDGRPVEKVPAVVKR